MREEYQKSIILFSLILIFSGLYVSGMYDITGERRNNIILFIILISCALISFIQTNKIKRWKEEKKTDYTFVYWSFFYFTLILVIYCSYMIVTRSELECMRLLKINMTGAGHKIYYSGQNTISNMRNNMRNTTRSNDISLHNDSSSIGSKINMRYLFDGYKKIWKTMLFMKN